MRNNLFLKLLCCTASACVQPDEVRMSGFDYDGWRRDSLACQGIRATNSKQLDKNLHLFQGKNNYILHKTLGPPNRLVKNNGRIFSTYFVGPGHQCSDSEWLKKENFNAEQVVFIMDKDSIIIGTTGIVYP